MKVVMQYAATIAVIVTFPVWVLPVAIVRLVVTIREAIFDR